MSRVKMARERAVARTDVPAVVLPYKAPVKAAAKRRLVMRETTRLAAAR